MQVPFGARSPAGNLKRGVDSHMHKCLRYTEELSNKLSWCQITESWQARYKNQTRVTSSKPVGCDGVWLVGTVAATEPRSSGGRFLHARQDPVPQFEIHNQTKPAQPFNPIHQSRIPSLNIHKTPDQTWHPASSTPTFPRPRKFISQSWCILQRARNPYTPA